MGRRHPVYTFRRAARRWSLLARLGCNESGLILPPHHTYIGTKGTFLAVEMSQITLDAYHLCVIKTSARLFSTVQMSISLSFGEHLATLSNLPIPRIEPSVRFLRPYGFRVYIRTNAAHQIDAPRGECVEYSRYGLQGRGDIFRHDIYVPSFDLDHVRCGKGRIICTSARV